MVEDDWLDAGAREGALEDGSGRGARGRARTETMARWRTSVSEASMDAELGKDAGSTGHDVRGDRQRPWQELEGEDEPVA